MKIVMTYFHSRVMRIHRVWAEGEIPCPLGSFAIVTNRQAGRSNRVARSNVKKLLNDYREECKTFPQTV